MAEYEVLSEEEPHSSSGEQQEIDIPSPAEQETPILIWTPGFIVLFGLVLTLGLSFASLLTQGWSNGVYPGGIVLSSYALLAGGLWVALYVQSKQRWIRLGSIFGFVWTFFVVFSNLLTLFPLNSAGLLPHLGAGSACALLGSYFCLSLVSPTEGRWDRWFFRLIPLLLPLSLLIAYAIGQTLTALEETLLGVALVLCCATWWLRPSCWRTQPSPALLFGLYPFIQLLLVLPHREETNFFYTQVMFLALLLGLIRTLQKERQKKRSPQRMLSREVARVCS